MRNCPKCNAPVDDAATFCSACGAAMNAASAPFVADPYDHTAEFDPKDISENKVVCMLIYLSGFIGILVALLLAGTSKYVGFHVRQALKFEVLGMLVPIALVVGAVINIIPLLGTLVYILAALAAGVLGIALLVIKIICFFSICNGKAKEPAIIKSLSFMR